MRKTSFFYLFAAIIIASFSSCTDHELVYSTINFEDVTTNKDSILKTNSFTSGAMNFQNNFTDYGSFSSWSGFACSSKKDMITAGYTNDLSVYANGAASGNKFGVFYYSSYDPKAYCSFANNAEYLVKELKLNNGTYAVLSMKKGGAFAKKFTNGDWFKVTIHGYKANGIATDSLDFYLADFRNGKNFICDSWTTVNIAKFGNINKLTFTFSSTDNSMFNGVSDMNTPAYVCIDDIKYIQPSENNK